MKINFLSIHAAILSAILFYATPALAAPDPATLLLKSGAVLRLNDGYRELVQAMGSLGSSNSTVKVVVLSIGGEPFIINMVEVVVLCKGSCNALKVESNGSAAPR